MLETVDMPLVQHPKDASRLTLSRDDATHAYGHALPLPTPTWSTPTREARARALLAAYRTERRDAGQRILLRELLTHFRAACMAEGHADPLARPARPQRGARAG